ncbi:hypothetical protein [Holospora curviuscula]|uniref:Uncharacterized protein n=1 Tax=Holospora curviuscula TaxID=1082868 RepID=A0A2S5R7Q7_9PROT|nr:hypothetical protein [Holospora curviuscula]PPE03155.1 hypothetical protein HCUR_01394 [Holospora curviuscula]
MMGARKWRVGKRHLGVDTLGYRLNSDVHSAKPHDRKCAKKVLL